MQQRLTCTFFLLFLLVQIGLSAQSYVPMVNRTQWWVNTSGSAGGVFRWYETTSDSSINGKVYQKVWEEFQEAGFWIREDVQNRKVYAIFSKESWQERLLYDFSLQSGDTVRLQFTGLASTLYRLDSMDALNTTMGFLPRYWLRKQAGPVDAPAELTWLLGVGSLKHPLYLDKIQFTDPVHRLICNFQLRSKLYDDGFGTCPDFPPALDLEPQTADRFEVYPQPANDMLFLDAGSGLRNPEIRILDLSGKVVRHFQEGVCTPCEIPTHDLKTGFYVLQLFEGGQLVRSKKMSVVR